MTIFATWLRGAMDAAGIDARRVAKAVGASEGTVHNWLHQGAMPSIKNIVELSRLFNVPTDTLIEDVLGFSVIPSRTPDERERRRAELLARLPRYADLAEKLVRLSPEKQDTFLTVIERLVPDPNDPQESGQ